jgi:hypothetical protein
MLNKLPSPGRSRISTLAALVLLLSGGCGQKTASVAAVRGTLTLNDKPLQSGNVVTIPSAGHGAVGIIQNGKFELSTFGKNDGAVPGTHKVAIVAREPAQGNGPEAVPGKLLVPERYTNPDASGLAIEVKAGEVNTPTLKLTSP